MPRSGFELNDPIPLKFSSQSTSLGSLSIFPHISMLFPFSRQKVSDSAVPTAAPRFRESFGWVFGWGFFCCLFGFGFVFF